jgi:hypothetical protein
MKTCSKCGADKDEENDFYKHRGRPRPWCKLCTNADNIARAAANPEKHNARAKAWREANPEKWHATTKKWRDAHPERVKANIQRTTFKIDFFAVWEAQKGICALCGDPMLPEGRELKSVVVDHDRSCCPGKRSCGKCVRGLIHWGCNMVLGYAQDDARILRCAADYVERHRRPLAAPQVEPASVVALCAHTG